MAFVRSAPQLPSTRVALSPPASAAPAPIAAPHRSLVERFGGYSVLVALVLPTIAFALAVAVLRSPAADGRMRARAKAALAVASVSLTAYTIAFVWLLHILFVLLALLVALHG